MTKPGPRPPRQPVAGHVVAQLRGFFSVPGNWAWAALPAAAGAAGMVLVATYQTGSAPAGWAGAGGVCLLLGLAIWLTYSVLATVPTLLHGSRLDAALRRDALTFVPVTAGLLLAAAGAWRSQGGEERLSAGVLTELAAALLIVAMGMKVFFLGADLSSAERLLAGRRAKACLLAAVVLAGVSIAAAAVWRHGQFLTFTSDLGTMDQTVWNTAHGRLLMYSRGLERLTSRPFTGRLELPFLFLAPLYRLWADPRLLQIAQALALSLGAVPLFHLARRRLGSDAAACVVAVAFVLHPALQGVGLAAVHTNAFAMPLLIAAFLSLDCDRPWAFSAWCFAALCCREDIALVTGPLGVYAAFRPRFRKAGLGVGLLSAAWLVVLQVLLPRLHGPAPVLGGVAEREMVGLLSQGLGGMAIRLVQQPSLLLTQLLREPNALYLAQLLVPLALLPLLSPRLLLVVVPGLGLNMVSGWGQMNDIRSQYQAYILPTLAVGCVGGAAYLCEAAGTWVQNSKWAGENEVRRSNVVPAVCLVCLACAVYGRATFGLRTLPAPPWPAEHTQALHRAVSSIPAKASVTAPQHVGPHLSQRAELFLPSDRTGLGDYVVCDAYESVLWEVPKVRRGEIRVLKRYPREVIGKPGYGIVSAEEGVVVLKRGAPHRAGLRRLYVPERLEALHARATVQGWQLLRCSQSTSSGRDSWLVDVTLTWRPEPGTGALRTALVCQADAGRKEIRYSPAEGLVPSGWLAPPEALVDRFWVCVGRDLGVSLKLGLETGRRTVPVGEVRLSGGR